MKSIFVCFLKTYQKILRPLFAGMFYLQPGSCRFYPTCSEYMTQAVIKYGFFKGLALGIRRILRCHPFSVSRYDVA
jgi:putative membrane protein insertion efficiency factor